MCFHNIFEQIRYNYTSIISVHGSSKEQFPYDHRNEKHDGGSDSDW